MSASCDSVRYIITNTTNHISVGRYIEISTKKNLYISAPRVSSDLSTCRNRVNLPVRKSTAPLPNHLLASIMMSSSHIASPFVIFVIKSFTSSVLAISQCDHSSDLLLVFNISQFKSSGAKRVISIFVKRCKLTLIHLL